MAKYAIIFLFRYLPMTQSSNLIHQARKLIPGGVNSPVRAFNGVGGDPIFFKAAEGAYLIDEDGNRYIDYVGSWGPMILGHRHPKVLAAITDELTRSLSFGAPTALELKLAEKISGCMPVMEMVRLVSTGTEATMTALRLARGFTKRNKILKFKGCYHGHADSLLVAAGSGALTLGVPSSAGVPNSIAAETLVADFNRIDSVKKLFAEWGNDIAAVIIEPIAGNMNLVPASKEFLQELRAICTAYDTVLIFDEVMTGFRVGLGGATEYYQIQPDLVTLAKVIGGGLPVAAFGGRKDIMSHLAPLGPVYQAGTLSGNPIAVACGLATLELVSQPNFFTKLTEVTQQLIQGIKACADKLQIPLYVNAIGGMFGIFFTDAKNITTFDDVARCDIEKFKKFFHAMLDEGIYLAPSAYEAGFVSAAHAEKEIQHTLHAAEKSFEIISEPRL